MTPALEIPAHDSWEGVLWEEATCLARLMMDELTGEYRYYFAPTEADEWFAWADWHEGVVASVGSHCVQTEKVAGDAGVCFVNGGALFQSREAAMRAIYKDVAQSAAKWATPVDRE